MRENEYTIRVPELEAEPSWIGVIITAILQLWPITAILALKNLRTLHRNSKLKVYRRYALIIGDRAYVQVSEIARATGKTRSLVCTELQEMIDKGYMGRRAYLDMSTDCIVIDPERRASGTTYTAQASQTARPAAAAPRTESQRTVFAQPAPRPQAAPVSAPQPAPAKAAPTPAEKQTENEFEVILRQIREVNDRIADKPMSQKIDRIGELTASIFLVVQTRPDQKEEVHKFLSYYLPTTMKLLESYSLLEKQSYQGENIVAARQDIEKIINTMVPAFEKQLDRLFEADALDISTDIDVLETMMAKDGLSEKEGTTLRMGGH